MHLLVFVLQYFQELFCTCRPVLVVLSRNNKTVPGKFRIFEYVWWWEICKPLFSLQLDFDRDELLFLKYASGHAKGKNFRTKKLSDRLHR
jgi:hypothetical protein